MTNTTLSEIEKLTPKHFWLDDLIESLNKTQADDEPLSFQYIYDTLGAQDLIWCAFVLPSKDRIILGGMYANTIRHLTDDKRVHDCIDLCMSGTATGEELKAANYDALNAYRDAAAYDARTASYTASLATTHGELYYAAANSIAHAAAHAATLDSDDDKYRATYDAAFAETFESLAKITLEYLK